MIVSMTAFGRREEKAAWGHAVWEIRTVNHRYLDVTVRLPEDLRMLENRVREQIGARLRRGKVDCILRYDAGLDDTGAIQLNKNLAFKITTAAQSLQISGAQPINPMDILRWPGVIENATPDPDNIAGSLLALLDATLEIVIQSRAREGQKLQALIRERCTAAKRQVELARAEFPAALQALREKITTRVRELVAEINTDRLEQEIAFLAQKMDVAEELDRLTAHIHEVEHIMDQPEPAGRRLDFLMQELQREANTLGAKAASLPLTNASVELKVLIEQMREQIQNIE
ncbi:MAG: YicC family protein [Gammaproteobacteria bacterium]|nr:YicC family protein [Gammaproteobacteria bacterium]